MKPILRFRVFESRTKPWQDLFGDASSYATTLDPRQLVSISHSADGNNGVVTVWFWDRVPESGGEEGKAL